MEFEIFHEGLDCDCIMSAKQNCFDQFARRVGHEGNGLKPRDFRVKEDRRKFVGVTCEQSCAERALSIDIWNDETREGVLERHKAVSNLSPQFRKSILIFKIKESGGLVKHTPISGEIPNPDHYDFYMPDHFGNNCNDCLEFITKINLE